MSKICGRCGFSNNDNAEVCGMCGVSLGQQFAGRTPIASQADKPSEVACSVQQQKNEQSNSTPYDYMQNQQINTPQFPYEANNFQPQQANNPQFQFVPGEPAKSSSKKLVFIAAGIIAVLIAVIVVLASALNNLTGVRGGTRKVFKAFESGNGKDISDLIGYDVWEKMFKTSYDDKDDLDEAIDTLEKSFEDAFDKYVEGTDVYFSEKLDDGEYELDYEIKEIEEIDEDEFFDFFVKWSGYDDDFIKDITNELGNVKYKKVEIDLIATDGDEEEDYTYKLYFIKDGGWKLIYLIPDIT